MMQTQISFFSVDRTLLRHPTARHFRRQGRREGLLSRNTTLRCFLCWLRYRRGKLTRTQLKQEVPSLRGMAEETIRSTALQSFRNRMAPDMRGDIESLVRLKKESGELIGLASSAPDILLEPLAEELQADTVIAGTAELDENNRATGRFSGRPCREEEKKRRVLAYLEERGIPPEKASFYSASADDTPLFSAVGHPVAVYPDSRLLRTARRNGWEILGS